MEEICWLRLGMKEDESFIAKVIIFRAFVAKITVADPSPDLAYRAPNFIPPSKERVLGAGPYYLDDEARNSGKISWWRDLVGCFEVLDSSSTAMRAGCRQRAKYSIIPFLIFW